MSNLFSHPKSHEKEIRTTSQSRFAPDAMVAGAVGLCLLASAASAWRGGEFFFGAVLGIGGFIGVVQSDSFDSSLALEISMAWIVVIAGVVVVVATMLLPRYGSHTTSVTQK